MDFGDTRRFQLLEQFALPGFSSRAEADQFWAKSDKRKFAMRRFFLFFGAAAFLAHGLLDIAAAGEQTTTMLVLRVLSVSVMLGLAGLFAVQTTQFRPDSVVIAYLLVPALTIVSMTLLAEPGTAADTYPFGLVILFAYGGTVLVPRFSKLLGLSFFTYVLYLATTPFSSISSGGFVVNLFFLTVGLSAICIGSLTRERLERQQIRIEKEMMELNADLALTQEEAIAARDTAIQARKTQAKFITSISHELRTPLNAIMGFSDFMINKIDGPISPPSYEAYIHDIHRSGEGLLLNINDLLDVHRLNASKMSWSDAKFSIHEMVRNSVVICRHEADKAGVALNFEAPPTDITAYGDTHRMTQVITNLLTNAIKFTDPGGQVTVTQVLEPSGDFRITVKDNGIGIAEDDLERVRSPFQQAEDGILAKKKGGLGLGLAIVSGILEQIDGRFEMDSELDVGTTCHVFIPSHRLFESDATASVA